MPGKVKGVEIDQVREKLIELIQSAVGGCSSYWAGLIADNLIANGVTIGKDSNVPSKWIPVTERLPEKEGRYLCVVRIGYRSGAVYVQIMNGDSQGFSLNHIYNDDVTHWMPLPEPPKGNTSTSPMGNADKTN